jgi:hypothetical protein
MMKKLMKVLSSGLLVVLLAGAFLFAFPSSTAHAEGLDDTPPGNGEKLGLAKQRLENIFEREKSALARQAENILRMDRLTEKAQDRIDALKAKGKDVSGLEAALAAFENALTDINASHAVAARLVAAHAGFADNGKVTDIEAAKETVQKVHDAITATRQMMVDAGKAIRQAIRQYRDTNAPVPTTQP